MAYFTMNRAADSGLFVVESIRQNKSTVYENILQIWQEARPGETPPRFDLFLDYMADDLDAARVDMIKSLERYLNGSKGSEGSTRERQDVVRIMRYWYQFVRDHCLNICGEQATKEMGFDLVTEQHPWRLERQSERAINYFKKRDPDEKVVADDPMKEEGAFRAGYIVKVLEAPHQQLTKILGSWISQRRGTEKALIVKDIALGNYQEKFAIFAKTAEMLYQWAGLKEEAKRIKPSSRRPGQREEEGKEEADPAAS